MLKIRYNINTEFNKIMQRMPRGGTDDLIVKAQNITQMKLPIFRSTLLVIFLILPVGCSPYTKGDPIYGSLPDKYAFLVLDIQNDFISKDGRLPIDQNQSKNIVNEINMLLSVFDKSKIEIIYIGNEFKEKDMIANWFRNHAAIEGTEGAKLAPDLKIVNSIYFAKNSPDAFSNNSFDKYLREKNITNLIVAGVFADQCVLSTVKGALNRKYKVYVISNAIGAKSDNNVTKALNAYKRLGINVVASEEIIKNFSK